jgi:hypothetical protein
VHENLETTGGPVMTIYETALALGFHLATVGFLVQETEKKPTVEVEYDRQRDFSQYQSYTWSESQEPTTKGADHIRITKAVTDRLAQLGFTIDIAEPDVRVRYRLETSKKKVHFDSSQRISKWDPTDVETAVRVGSHEETVIALEMFDTETNALIWRAKCTHVQGPPDRMEESIYDTVERLFQKYPTEIE